MARRSAAFFQAFAMLAAAALAAAAAGAEDILPRDAERILKKHGVPKAHTGLYISWGSGEPIAMLNVDKPFNPASSIKLVTSMAALDLLGPGHVWDTRLLSAAPVVDGSLRGDLYLQGGGDPYMTSERLLGLVAGLRRRGIASVAGDVVVDDSLFEFASHNPSAFDGAGTKPYNASPGAAVVNFGATRVILHTVNGKVNAFLDPPSSTFELVNQLKLRKARCTGNWRRAVRERLSRNEDGTARLVLSGRYSTGCGEQSFYLLGQSDPRAHVAGAVTEMFEIVGGEVQGGWRVDKTPRNAKTVVAIESETLAEAIRGMNKFSNNFMARNIFLSLGGGGDARVHTLAKARSRIDAWLQEMGIDTAGLFIDNGSGLSRDTRITPLQFGRALSRFNRSPLRHEMISSLAVLGRDGTARNWNRRRASAGNAHIKTGTLSNARSTVGVVHNPHGDVVFVMMVQTRGTAAARRAIQDMLDWLYKIEPAS